MDEQKGTIETSQTEGAPKKKIREMTPEERRAYGTAWQQKNRAAKALLEDKNSRQHYSLVEIKPKDAKEILAARGINNPHVIDFCVELAQRSARDNKVPFNHHLLAHGLRATLAKTTLPEVTDEEVETEILYRRDLFALYDYGFYRQPDVTFEQWLADRHKFKSSAFELSKILGKEDFGATHEEWTAFAPHWNPIGLKPDYSQKQALAWLDAQRSDTEGDKKRYLLVASRNSMKSTWVRILALCLTITYPDARILIVSETNKLSKKAMKEFRGYLEMAPSSPTLFQQYFGEFTIASDEGQSLVYDNPLARLGLPQNSVESSSMESANTGSRFDFCIFDDPISRDNGTANEEQRAAAISKHGSIMKLREPAGFAINVQTPWASGDLGDVMIERNEEDSEHSLAVRIDPVMIVRHEAAMKPLLELKEEDVVLNFLPKLNWRFVRDEMRSPEGINFFKTQYMTEWPSEEEESRLHFDSDLLTAACVPQSAIPQGDVYFGVDISYSLSARSDLTSISVVRAYQNVHNERCVGVIHQEADRMRGSELALRLVLLTRQYNPRTVIIEKGPTSDSLETEIRRAAGKYETSVPTWYITPSNVKGAKFSRIRELEYLLNAGRLKFGSGLYIDPLFLELSRLDGSVSSAKKKDDRADSLAIITHTLRITVSTAEKSGKGDEYDTLRKMDEAAALKAQHERIFGGVQYQQRPLDQPPPEPKQSPLHDYGKKLLGPGWRV